MSRFLEVLCARNIDGVGTAMHHGVLVEKQMPSHLPFQPASLLLLPKTGERVGFHIIAVVMIAQHTVYAVLGTQGGKHPDVRLELGRTGVLNVASETNHIGMLGIDAVDITLWQIAAPTVIGSSMEIAEEDNAIAVETGRKLGHSYGDALHLQLTEAISEAIKENADGQEAHDKTYEPTPVAPALEYLHHTPAYKTEQGIDEDGNGKQRHDDKPHVDKHRTVGHEVGL